MQQRKLSSLLFCAALCCLVLSCVMRQPGGAARHRWWAGLGPVMPHDSFPSDCALCHVGDGWHELAEDFQFDHERETGVALVGAHSQAQCLRCHNDRGPVAQFQSRGCAGCHEDIHLGELGVSCDDCHNQNRWILSSLDAGLGSGGPLARHNHTRFPLVGAHASTSCRRCHPGAEVGNFWPTDTECITCHASDLAQTTNHVGLGWVNRCDRCHMPTTWQQAELD